MFANLRFKIALFFALGGFVLLVVQSIVFMFMEHRNDIQRLEREMAEDAQRIVHEMSESDVLDEEVLSPVDQNIIRLFDFNGDPEFIGLIFQGEEVILRSDPWILNHGNEYYHVLTFPILLDGDISGYFQIGEEIQTFPNRLFSRMFTVLFLSGLLSSILFLVGMKFEAAAMQPAHRAITYMEQFAQNAGHELKAPLANMRSSLDVALRSGEHKTGLEEINYDLQRMIQLVESLLELETIDESAVQRKPLNLSMLAQEITQKFKEPLREKDIRINAVVEPGVIRLADEHLIRTMLSNLVQNAGKFTPEGGTITLVVNHSYLEVQDSGVGMAEEIVDRIFDRFFKADTMHSNNGFGLGLALVKRIIDIHQWNITVMSTPGIGTTFRISFPKK